MNNSKSSILQEYKLCFFLSFQYRIYQTIMFCAQWLPKRCKHSLWCTAVLDMDLLHGIGPKPIIISFSGMNIHLLAILGFISCQGFDP